MASTSYQEIKDSLRQLYVEDPRPWLVGFSGGKDSTLVAALVLNADAGGFQGRNASGETSSTDAGGFAQ